MVSSATKKWPNTGRHSYDIQVSYMLPPLKELWQQRGPFDIQKEKYNTPDKNVINNQS